MNKLIIEGQALRQYSTEITLIAGGTNFAKLYFSFDSEWDNFKCVAQFKQNEIVVDMFITNDMCYVPAEIKQGQFQISVWGFDDNGNKAITNAITLDMTQTSIDDVTLNKNIPTPSLLAQVLAWVQNNGTPATENVIEVPKARTKRSAALDDEQPIPGQIGLFMAPVKTTPEDVQEYINNLQINSPTQPESIKPPVIVQNRRMEIPEVVRYIGVAGDRFSESITFIIDRFSDGYDLNDSKQWWVETINAQGEYDVSVFDPDKLIIGEDTITLEYEIQPRVVLYAGNIQLKLKSFLPDDFVWQTLTGNYNVYETFATGQQVPQPGMSYIEEAIEQINQINQIIDDFKEMKEGPPGKDGVDGKSAYEVAVDEGFVGTEVQWLASLKGNKGDKGDTGDAFTYDDFTEEQLRNLIGPKGDTGDTGSDGKSAYQIALENGYIGNEQAWLASLKGDAGADGKDGSSGKSAYQVAIDNGFVGSEVLWLQSLVGKSAYQEAKDAGFEGTEQQWLDSLKGKDGRSAYQVALDNGYIGSESAWVASLTGKSAYQTAVDNGYTGSEEEWNSEVYRKSNVSEDVQSLLSQENNSKINSQITDITDQITSENLNDFTFYQQLHGRSVAHVTDIETQSGAIAPTSWGILTTERAGSPKKDFAQQWQDAFGNLFVRSANENGWSNDPSLNGKDAWIAVTTEDTVLRIKEVTSSTINDFEAYHTEGNNISITPVNPTNSNNGNLAPRSWGDILTFSRGDAGVQFFVDPYAGKFATRSFEGTNWNDGFDTWKSDNYWANLSDFLGSKYVEYTHLNLATNTQVDINVPFGKTYSSSPKIMFSVGNRSKASAAAVNLRDISSTRASFFAHNVGTNAVDVVIYMLILPNAGG